MNAFWVALGGAIGAVLRFGANEIGAKLAPQFPWHTFAVNVAGCLAMGVIAGLVQAKFQLSDSLRLFLTTGILGGFTTFSAFALDFAVLFERQSHAAALGYMMGSVVFSLGAVFAGLALARMLA